VRELYKPAREIRRWPKYIGAFNHFPQFKSFGDAMLRRCIVIAFGYKVKKEELIDDLHGKIIKGGELPAIVYRSLMALQRLNANGFTFTSTPDSVEALSMMEDASSSVASYVKKFWQADQGGKVPFGEVYDSYVSWTDKNRHKPVSSTRFSREAMEIIGKTRAMNRVGVNDGKNFMGYRISRKPELEVKFEPTGDPVADQYALDFNGEVVKEPDL
jgi:phage/plasmid-associated DNA primase